MDNELTRTQGKYSPRFEGVLAGIGCRLHHVLYFFDIAFLMVSALVLYLVLGLGGTLENVLSYTLVVLIATLAFSLFAFQSGTYDWHRFRQLLRKPTTVLAAVLFAFGCLLVIGFALKVTDQFSRLWSGLWFSSVMVYVLGSRLALYRYLSRPAQRHLVNRRAIILGAGDQGRRVLDHILRYEDQDIHVIGFLDDRVERLPKKSYRGVPVLGRTDQFEQLLRYRGTDLVIIALPWAAHDRIKGLIKKLSTWSVDIYMALDHLGLDHADRPMHRLGGMHVLNLRDRPIGEWDAVIKRIEDLVIAVPAVVVLSPLLALIALAIRLESKGPVLFVQERYGFHHEPIRVYKFRSMYTEMTDLDCERQTVKGDPRVTRVGRFIRATSLDELPQLFNVVLGCMSVVGPRPHAKGTKAEGRLFEEVVDEYASRHRVKPGITGWAQCNGWRGETDTREKIEKRVEHDLYYIENWSVFLDILIILKTLKLLFKKDGNAY